MSEDINIIMNNFTKELKKARLNAFLSQAKVAESLGVTPQQYQKYESGKNRISIKMLMSFCLYLNIDIIKFLDKCINSHPNTDADILPKQLQLQLTLTKEKM